MPSDNKFSHLQNALRSRRVYTDPVTGEPLPRQVRAGDLQPHPDNPKIHTDKQHDYVAGSLDELGQYDGIIINIRNGFIIDGHERAWLALGYDEDMLVDVDWVELTEDEHRKALVVTDYSRTFALWDTENLERILSELGMQDDSYLQDARVGEMLDRLSVQQGIIPNDFDPNQEWVGMPEFEQETIKPFHSLILHFQTEQNMRDFAQLIVQNIETTTRYLYYPKQEKLIIKNIYSQRGTTSDES